KRRRSADHERVFFQLLGYTLRPGFGYPLDEWRCDQSFALFAPGVQFHREKPNWIEFWVMWRRAAGGLNESAHAELWRYLKPHLERKIPLQPPKATGKAKGVEPEGLDEMVRTAASLEHLAPEEKAQLGDWVVERLSDPSQSGGPWAWALGRIGTRVPLYGSSHRVVSAAKAEQWIELLLQRGLQQFDGGPFAAAQLARLSGDRARDVDPNVGARVAEALGGGKAPAFWLKMVNEVVVWREADGARALGDPPPAGLQLS